ncbi:MAG: hypothetical protein HY720_02580 [Planctomycetes bacterium]|nr:hypothetical protein [Planctomycetota bacterium]
MGNLEEFEAHLKKFRGAEPPPDLIRRLARARLTRRIAVVAALAAAVAVVAALGLILDTDDEPEPAERRVAPAPGGEPPRIASPPHPERPDYASLRAAAAGGPETLDLALARAAGRIFPEPAKPVTPGSSRLD